MSPALNLETLQKAVEQLRPELPTLVGTEYPAFAAQLESYLSTGSINRLLDLFGRHTAAHQRLLEVLPSRKEDSIKGLFGDVNISLPYLYYLCPGGPHVDRMQRVEQHDAAGRPLCRDHHLPMRRIESQELRASIELLRPELPQLLGLDHPGFIAKFNAKLLAPSDDEMWVLFDQHDAAYQRLLQVLASS